MVKVVKVCDMMMNLSHCLTTLLLSFGSSKIFSSFFEILVLYQGVVEELEVVAVVVVALVAAVAELGVAGAGTQSFASEFLAENQNNSSKHHMLLGQMRKLDLL